MKEYTKPLAAWAANLRYEEIPAALIEKLKDHTLDMLGCAVAGWDRPEILRMKDALLHGQSEALVWGTGRRIHPSDALLINGAMSHAVELDDLHKPSKIHAACVVVPSVLTVGEMLHLDGRALLRAMAVGYEVCIRMGMALGTDSHRRRGWHATATCGSFASAAAIGSLMGLDEVRMANALGLAGTQTGGLMAYTADGSMAKRFHAGKANANGWLAATLAASGFTGPTYVLEAPDGGYAHAASDAYDLDSLLEGLGARYHALDTGLKSYACCGHIHQAIDAAIYLVKNHGIRPADVREVEVRTYDVSGMAWGFHDAPKNTVEAQFNIPWAVAVAMLDGQAFLPQFAQDRLADSRVISLAKRVTVVADDRYTARYPGEWCSSVRITLNDGSSFYREVCGAKGDPVNPLSREELRDKFNSLTGTQLPQEKKEAIADFISGLEERKDLKELFLAMECR
ncbi:MAG: MmgE/PrpD family protein [Clostridia bacterium]|nr:MmgE/PrpD family protein [Clostridia bacterium]